MQVTEMDALCNKIAQVKREIAELEENIEVKKESIKDIMHRVEEYFVETNREQPYNSPFGTLYIRKDLDVIQPKGQKLREIFDHFKKIFGEEMAWSKMSIHNQVLKSEIKDHVLAVEARGGDPILEPFPGVEPPKVRKSLQYRKAKA